MFFFFKNTQPVFLANNEMRVIPMFGDSTMLGRADKYYLPIGYRYLMEQFPSVRVWNYITSQLELLEWDVNNGIGNFSEQFGPELQYANLLGMNAHLPAVFVKYAIGGSSLAPTSVSGTGASWDKTEGPHYDNLINYIDQAMNALKAEGWNPSIDRVMINLGLNDTNQIAAATAYETNLTNLIADLYTDCSYLSTDILTYIGRPNAAADVDPTNMASVRTATFNVVSNDLDGKLKMVDQDGLGLKDDLIHHSELAEADPADSVALRFFTA